MEQWFQRRTKHDGQTLYQQKLLEWAIIGAQTT